MIEIIVCSTEKYDCMMSVCTDCPGKEALLDMIYSSDEYDLLPNSITHKNRLQPTELTWSVQFKRKKNFFLQKLGENIKQLKRHHYVSKTQAQFCKEKKTDLQEKECLVFC